MDFKDAATLVGGLAAFFVALAVLWRGVRYVFKVDKAMPVLLSIAAQFENNGGGSLKDSIDRLNRAQADLTDLVTRKWEEQGIENRIVLGIAEDSRLVADTNAKIVNELSSIQMEEIQKIREYLHDKMHEINNNISVTNLQASLTEKRSARIEERLDKLLPLVVRHRATDRPDNERESAS